MQEDKSEFVHDTDFMEFMAEEDNAMKYFQSLPGYIKNILLSGFWGLKQIAQKQTGLQKQ